MKVPVHKSNMLTKNYCTECGSFDLTKLHRSYLGRSFNVANKLRCNNCNTVISPKAFLANELRDVPLVREPLQVNAFTASDVEIVESPFEAVVTESQEVVRARDTVAGVDLIIDKEKSRVRWPYILGSLAIFCGVAYSLSGMPLLGFSGVSNSISYIQDALEGETLVTVADERRDLDIVDLETEALISQETEVDDQLDKQQILTTDESASALADGKALEMVSKVEEKVIATIVPVLVSEVEVPKLEASIVIDSAVIAESNESMKLDMKGSELAKVAVIDVSSVLLKGEAKVATISDAKVVLEVPTVMSSLSSKQVKKLTGQSVVKTIKGDLDSLFD